MDSWISLASRLLGLTERRLCARAMVGLELGGGGGGGLVGFIDGQFIDMLTMLGDFGGGDGFLPGAVRPAIAAGGTGLVGLVSSGGGLGATFCLPKFNAGGFFGMSGGFRATALSVESFCMTHAPIETTREMFENGMVLVDDEGELKTDQLRTDRSDGFLLAGGGCGGGPRLTDELEEMDEPDVEPFIVFGFHVDDDAVSAEGGLTGPIRPLPVGFNDGIPPWVID